MCWEPPQSGAPASRPAWRRPRQRPRRAARAAAWTSMEEKPTRNRSGSRRTTYGTSALERGRQRRDYLKQVADDAVVGDFENGRIGILVDCDDRVRSIHADQML